MVGSRPCAISRAITQVIEGLAGYAYPACTLVEANPIIKPETCPHPNLPPKGEGRSPSAWGRVGGTRWFKVYE